MMEDIVGFINQYSYLSNMHPCNVEYEGDMYPSLENAYHAAKVEDRSQRVPFQWMTPHQSKAAGRRVAIRANWDSIKLNVMYDCILSKFSHQGLKTRLLNTGTAKLIHFNTHHDRYWGMVMYNQKASLHGNVMVGEDHLGKLLMRARNALS